MTEVPSGIGAPRRGRLRVEVVLAEPGEDVRRERRAARAGSAQLVLDRLGELGHRHAGDDERRRRGHRPLDGDDRAPHRRELLGGLDPAQLVHEPRAGAQAVGAEDPGELERRLGPDPVADREDARAGGVARDALEDGRTRRPSRSRSRPRPRAARRRSKVANIRGSTNTGSAPGPEEGAGDPPVRVERLAEARHRPLDAGQVLEIRRRPEEESRDAFGLEALLEPTPSGGVVEHRASLVATLTVVVSIGPVLPLVGESSGSLRGNAADAPFRASEVHPHEPANVRDPSCVRLRGARKADHSETDAFFVRNGCPSGRARWVHCVRSERRVLLERCSGRELGSGAAVRQRSRLGGATRSGRGARDSSHRRPS